MSEKEKPAGQGGLHDLPRRSGVDEFEDRVRDAVRKQDQLLLESTIGELLTALGPPEHDNELVRKRREFLCRVLVEPLDAVGLIWPASGSDEHRVIVAFRGEDFSRHFIGNDFLMATLLAARLRRLRACELRYFTQAEGGAE